ncbi:MAG: hypothetical protein Q4A78_12840 [Peptostreptococcaceae bacterium]|nr:hypothetical protein [Peptostreptococcaceae bacterium]
MFDENDELLFWTLATVKISFIHGRSLKHNVPNFDSLLRFRPDLVIGSSYSFRSKGGVADASEFEELGIHIYARRQL